MVCPLQLYRAYRWLRVRDEVPRLHALSMLCETPARKRARADRAKNRRRFIKKGKVKRGDLNHHIHHKDGNNRNNRSANLVVLSASKHRRLHRQKRRL